MKPADRIALTERLARAFVWSELPTTRRDDYIRQAREAIKEIETTDEQMRRIGWLLVEVDEEAEPVE